MRGKGRQREEFHPSNDCLQTRWQIKFIQNKFSSLLNILNRSDASIVKETYFIEMNQLY